MPKQKYDVTYVSKGPNKTTQKTSLVVKDRAEAVATVEAGNNRVISAVYMGMVYK